MSHTLLQPAAFLAMAYAGIIAGFVYDFFRLFRRVFASRAVTVIADALFLPCFALITVLGLLSASSGEVRPYLFLGYFSGILIEQWSVSVIIFGLFYRIRDRFLKE